MRCVWYQCACQAGAFYRLDNVLFPLCDKHMMVKIQAGADPVRSFLLLGDMKNEQTCKA